MPDVTNPDAYKDTVPTRNSYGDEPAATRRHWRVLRAHPRAFAGTLGLLTYPFALGLLFSFVFARTVPHDFMEISCQVLAVLILALAVQTRLLSVSRFEEFDDRLETQALVVGLLLGELAPLAALLCGTDSVILATPAAYSILLSLGLIVAYALFGTPRSLDPGMVAARGNTTLDGASSPARVSIRWL